MTDQSADRTQSASGTRDPLLEVRDLAVTFATAAGDITAVHGLTYDVLPGEVLGLVGESGSGKTVSSLAIMDLLPASARCGGSVRFRGKELLGAGDDEMSAIRGAKIAMIFQDPLSALTPVYTIGDQIAEALLVHNSIDKRRARERAIELLNLVGIPDPSRRADSFPHQFSGGMRQRVMIAMAIANDPELIIADEPTTALDVTIQAQIMEVLLKAKQVTGAAIIMITHDLGVLAGFADRIAVMYAGKLVECGDVDDIYYHSRMPYTLGLLASIPRIDTGRRNPLTQIDGNPPSPARIPSGCPFHPRCPIRIDVCDKVEPTLTQARTASSLAPAGPHVAACHRSSEIPALELQAGGIFPRRETAVTARSTTPRADRAKLLEVLQLSKTFSVLKGSIFRRRVGTIAAVDGVSFDIHEGETLALVGESGCGKTTTILEILELHKPESGTVVVMGKNTSSLTRDERTEIRGRLQIVFQDPMASLDPRLPVGDIIAEPLQTHGVPAATVTARVRELLKIVGLHPEDANRFPSAFSGGQRQRINIARALALQPRLLVLDEPVSALDVSIRAGIINLLEELRAKFGLSYLFVSHDLSVVRYIADRVAVMYLGRFVEIGDINVVFDRPAHPYTQALLSANPIPDPNKERARRRIVLQGDIPNPADPPSGCRFRTRCQVFAGELTDSERQKCINESPALSSRLGEEDRQVACHYATATSVV